MGGAWQLKKGLYLHEQGKLDALIIIKERLLTVNVIAPIQLVNGSIFD
jgi:hypothetical protein